MADWLSVCFAHNQTAAYAWPQIVGGQLFKKRREASEVIPQQRRHPPAGFAWNPLGVAFTQGVFDFQMPQEREFRRAVLEKLLPEYDRHVLLYDHVRWHGPNYARSAKHANGGIEADQLYRDGFAKIDSSWGLAEVLTERLRDAISSRLHQNVRTEQARFAHALQPGDEPPSTTANLPELVDTLLPHLLPRLGRVARAYLGDDAQVAVKDGGAYDIGRTTAGNHAKEAGIGVP